MPHNLLILGGTTEASSLAQYIAKTDMKATISYAGRVERIRPQPIPKRIGGFGGIDGLASYLTTQAITHVIDATHPFASQMSCNAIVACEKANV
ncbi:MAG: precorrin-6A/cobalt-precorrin-6A reductase, partial [Candidatus Puniceispirillaceae bacterium]